MTEGSISKNILLFSLPLVISNCLQTLFNLADVAVVGNFAGTIALGAVGSTTIVISLTTGILLGMGAGVNAVIAHFTGAGDSENVKKSVHSALILCLMLGLILLACGLFLTRPLLTLIGTKDELMDGAALYLTVYLLGSPALAVYNHGNATLSAIGDTKRPLKYLIVSGILNIILNLIFVICFKLDVLGVALASIISQYLSAFLVLRYLFTCKKEYGLYLKDLKLDTLIAKRVLSMGVPTAIQYSLFAIANLYIQSAVNTFDHVVVEGNSAAVNLDGLVYDIMGAFYTACTSFIAQNHGAGNISRIKKCYFVSLAYSATIGAVLGFLLAIFRYPVLSLFTSDADVLKYGAVRLFIMGLSYFISAFMDDSAAAARGLGKSVIPTVIVILGSVVFRIIWVLTIFRHFHTLTSLYTVYACAWTFTAAIGNIYFFYSYKKIKAVQ